MPTIGALDPMSVFNTQVREDDDNWRGLINEMREFNRDTGPAPFLPALGSGIGMQARPGRGRGGPYRDTQRPRYNNGAIQDDHARSRALGGTNDPSNVRGLPAETNFRKGGHEGRLVRDWLRMRQAGMTDAQIAKVLGPEIQSMINSPVERPTDPAVLDLLPDNPLQQERPRR